MITIFYIVAAIIAVFITAVFVSNFYSGLLILSLLLLLFGIFLKMKDDTDITMKK